MVCCSFGTSLYMTIPQIWDTFEMRASINREITFGVLTQDSPPLMILQSFGHNNPLEVRTRSEGNVEPSPNFHGHRQLIMVAPCVHGRLVSATESITKNSSLLKI